MDIGETLVTSLEKLKKLGDKNNEQLPDIQKYVQDEISALLDAEAPIRENWMKMVHNLASSFPGLDAELSGSAVEGAMMARIFQVDKDCELVRCYAQLFRYSTRTQSLA